MAAEADERDAEVVGTALVAGHDGGHLHGQLVGSLLNNSRRHSTRSG